MLSQAEGWQRRIKRRLTGTALSQTKHYLRQRKKVLSIATLSQGEAACDSAVSSWRLTGTALRIQLRAIWIQLWIQLRAIWIQLWIQLRAIWIQLWIQPSALWYLQVKLRAVWDSAQWWTLGRINRTLPLYASAWWLVSLTSFRFSYLLANFQLHCFLPRAMVNMALHVDKLTPFQHVSEAFLEPWVYPPYWLTNKTKSAAVSRQISNY